MTRPVKRAGILLVTTLLGALHLTGCGSARKGESLTPSPRSARSILSESWDQLQRFEGGFTLNLQTPDYHFTLAGTCELQHPDRFRGRLLGPFGIRLGEIVVRGNEYRLRTAKGEVMEGRIDELNIEELTGIALPTEDLLSFFDPSARPPSKHVKTVSFTTDQEEGSWLWRVDEGTAEREIQLDPAKRTVLSERWITRDGVLLLTKEYDQQERVNGVQVAHRLVMESNTLEPVRAELNYRTLRLSPNWKDDPFSLMESVRR